MLSVENLAYHYKGRPAVLKDVNFKVNTGEFLAILGNNGVGKSTMLKCFNKILTPDGGKIILDDENLLQMSARQVAQRVAFVAQNVPSTQMTVHDMVMLGRRPYMKWGFTEDDHQIVHHAMDQPASALHCRTVADCRLFRRIYSQENWRISQRLPILR